MHLPAEIRTLIACHLLTLEFDHWYSKDYFRTSSNNFASEDPLNGCPLYRLATRGNCLYVLRLVSRDWYYTVSSLLHDHRWWIIRSEYGKSLEWIENVCLSGDELQLKHGHLLPLTRVVSKLKLEINDTDAFIRKTKADDHKRLRKLFGSFGRIDAFHLFMSGEVSDDRYEEAFEEIAATCRHGLESSTFRYLTDLRLTVICTRDVERFTRGLDNEIRCQLKHLYMRITDQTGFDGHPDNAFHLDMEVVMDDGEVDFDEVEDDSRSKIQMRYPNKAHQNHVWEMVASCPNLESLSITGTQFLDLDQLQWERPATFGGLRALALDRVYLSVPSLLALIKPTCAADASPKLRCINLKHAKISRNGGEWLEVLTFLKDSCPDLMCSRLYELTYHSTHGNYVSNGQLSTEELILTTNYPEEDAIESLTRHLAEKAGRGRYPKDCLESVWCDYNEYREYLNVKEDSEDDE